MATCDMDLLRESRARFGRPQVIGHRGGRSFAPENTLPAFTSCFDRGGDACELDARLTADDQLVVMHDDSVDRTTDGHGRIAEMTLAEITSLRNQGRPIPALREVFEAVRARGRLQLHVKLEEDEPRSDRLLVGLAAMIGEYGFEERCSVLAIEAKALEILRYNPKLHLDVEIAPGPVAEALERRGRGFFVAGGHRLKTSDFDLPDDTMVRDAHAEGIPLVCWARDSSDESVERLLRLGVDSIMTDYPERMGALIEKVQTETEKG